MNYWIIALPRDKMLHCIDVGTFGLNRKFVLGRMEPGDRIACYVTKEFKIVAFGEVTEPYYIDDEKVFPWASGSQMFVDRIKFKAQKLDKNLELNFIDYLDKMSFIKNIVYWSAHFNGSVVQISQKDWELLHGQDKKNGVKGKENK